MRNFLIRLSLAVVFALLLSVPQLFSQEGFGTSSGSSSNRLGRTVAPKQPTLAQQRKQMRNDMYSWSVMRQIESGQWIARPSAGFPSQFTYRPQLHHIYIAQPYQMYYGGY